MANSGRRHRREPHPVAVARPQHGPKAAVGSNQREISEGAVSVVQKSCCSVMGYSGFGINR